VIEEVVGQALKGRRDNIVLATKAHMPLAYLRGDTD
jgi:aryl-alcohol dehydrogenase-like predicted oxidoreductase